MQDDKDGSIKNLSIANSEVVMNQGQYVITVDDLYTKGSSAIFLLILHATL
jgi:adenine/guanine phosphoribosyltransferase-like PRPP-binding protein